MKTVKLCMLILAGLLTFTFANGQTVDDIIAKHIDAIGGQEKVSQVKSIYIETTVQVMGSDNPSTTTIVNGVGYRNESEFNGQKLIQCYTDKGGWAINPFAGGTDAQSIPEEQFKSVKNQIYIAGPLVDYATKGYKAELLPMEDNSFKIKLTSPDGIETTYFINSTSYYITKAIHKGEIQGQSVEINTTYSDYRKTDFGYVVPFKTDMDFGQFQMSYTVNKVEVNKEIDPKIFDMPK